MMLLGTHTNNEWRQGQQQHTPTTTTAVPTTTQHTLKGYAITHSYSTHWNGWIYMLDRTTTHFLSWAWSVLFFRRQFPFVLGSRMSSKNCTLLISVGFVSGVTQLSESKGNMGKKKPAPWKWREEERGMRKTWYLFIKLFRPNLETRHHEAFYSGIHQKVFVCIVTLICYKVDFYNDCRSMLSTANILMSHVDANCYY